VRVSAILLTTTESENIEQFVSSHAVHCRVIGIDDGITRCYFLLLYFHYLLFNGVFYDESINIKNFLLTDSMRPVHGLQISERIMVVLEENDSICSYIKKERSWYQRAEWAYKILGRGGLPVKLSPRPPTRVVSNITLMLGS